MQEALNSFQISTIDYDIEVLGRLIMAQIRDVGRLHLLSIGDLEVFSSDAATPPVDVKAAVRYGTKFFDALLYFAIEQPRRPVPQAGVDVGDDLPTVIMNTKRYLLWMAIFLMLRGSYPSEAGNNVGTNVPAFLRNICGMDISPLELANKLASFDLKNLNPNWIKQIDWSGFAPEIRQRLALGLSGYRMLSPFGCYQTRADAPQDAVAAADYIRQVLARPLDYAILSCTRSPEIVNRFKSWNKALGNLMLIVFTDAQLDEMVANRIIFAKPTRDPRADTWRGWVAGGLPLLNDPVRL